MKKIMLLLILASLQSLETALAQSQIRVTDSFSMPIANAQVLIGSRQGTPFKNNFLITDAAGVLTAPVEWNSPESVTVDAPGFIRQTIIKAASSGLLVQMAVKPRTTPIEISGEITNLPVINKDKLVDFGLVLHAVDARDFHDMTQETFLSPFYDTLTLLGNQVPVFSNVSLPEQKESFLIPLTVTKPIFKKFTLQEGPLRLVALSGKFPFKRVVDDLKAGKSFFDLLNYFELNFTATHDVFLKNTTGQISFSGVAQPLKKSLSVQSPHTLSDEKTLIIPLNTDQGKLIPTDLKTVTQGQSTMVKTGEGAGDLYILSIVKKTNEFAGDLKNPRLSASLTKMQNPSRMVVLPIMNAALIKAGTPYTVSVTTLPHHPSLSNLTTKITLADMQPIYYNNEVIKTAQRTWEVYADQWESSVTFPEWPLDTLTGTDRPKFIDVTYTAADATAMKDLLPSSSIYEKMKASTHFTKTTQEISF